MALRIPSRKLTPLLLCSVLLGLAASHCGARTPLLEPGQAGAGGQSSQDAAVTDTGKDAKDGQPADALDAASDKLPDTVLIDSVVPDVSACTLQPAGKPLQLLTFEGKDPQTASLVVLDPGDATTARPADVALQAVVSDPGVHITRLRVDEPWPSGIAISGAPTPVGEGYSYGQMTHAPGNIDQLALTWAGFGEGPSFRTVDISSWTLGPLQTIPAGGGTPSGLAAGKGLPSPGSLGYEGEGYALAWPIHQGNSEYPAVVILSATGAVQVGPINVMSPTVDLFPESSVAWTGSTYLLATRATDCAPGDPLCVPRSVVVSRLNAAPGVYPSVEVMTTYPASQAAWTPGYPTLLTTGQGALLVWDEGASSSSPRTVRVARFSADGNPLGPDQVVSQNARPKQRPWIGAGPSGPVVGWGEDGDASLPDGTLGRSRMIVQTLTEELALQGPALSVDITAYRSMGWPAGVTLAYPSGFLLVWSAARETTYHSAVWALLFRCL